MNSPPDTPSDLAGKAAGTALPDDVAAAVAALRLTEKSLSPHESEALDRVLNHLAALQRENAELKASLDYLRPLVPVLEGREAKLAKQLLFSQSQLADARAQLAERERELVKATWLQVGKLENDECVVGQCANEVVTKRITLLQWFIRQCQGESGAGESYWEQFREYREARKIVDAAMGQSLHLTEDSPVPTEAPLPYTDAQLKAAMGQNNGGTT